MNTTKNHNGVPRVLVRLSHESKMKLIEMEIIDNNGQVFKLCLKAPSYEEVDKYEMSVKIGDVIGVSPGVTGIEVGDIVIIDYTVDADADYQVTHEGKDKIVSVPCQSRLHKKDITVTSYYTALPPVPGKEDEPPVLKYTGERNVKVAKKGDVDEMSLVLAVVKKNEIIPSEFYVLCEFKEELSGIVLQPNGMFGYNQKEETHIRRKVLFAHPSTGLKQGDYILAVPESNFETTIFEKKFDVVPIVDVLAID